MAATYTYTDSPSSSASDAVRIVAGDTGLGPGGTAVPMRITDAQIAYAISKQPNNVNLAAAVALDNLAGQFAAQASFSVGQISKQLAEVAKNVREQAAALRREAGKMAGMFFGGLTQSGKDLLDQNADEVKPPFTVGAFDSPLVKQFDGSHRGNG